MTPKFRHATLLVSTALCAPSVAMAQAQEPAAQAPAASTQSRPASRVATGSPDQAERAAPAQTVTPGDIIVTARRRDERLIDVPVAITAVSGQTLTQLQATRVSDIATLVPTLIAGKAASGSSASVFLRGVGSSSLSAGFDLSVSFVIDGLPLSRGREIGLPQFDIQSVDVLKGPQALYFGKNTTGGLISITSNGPTNTFQAGIKSGYGFEAQDKYVEAYVSGPVSDNLRVRLAGRYDKSNGAFTNTSADSYTNYIPGQFRTRYSDRRGFSENYGIRGTADWDVSPNFKLQLKAGINSAYDGGPTDLVERVCGSGRTTPLPTNFGGMIFPASPNADCTINGKSDSSAIPVQVAQANYRYAGDGKMYADFKSQYGILTGTITSDPFDVTSITGYYHFRQTDLNNVSGESYPAGFSQLTDFKQVSEEVRFQSKFDGPINMLFGGFYAHGTFIFNTDAYILPLPLDAINNTYTSFKRDDGFSNDSLSFFLQGTLNFTSKLQLSAGARESIEARNSYQRSLPASAFLAAAFPPGIVLTDRYRAQNLSPEVTLRYKPGADTTFYASYKQGFKAGGFNLSQTLTPGMTPGVGRYAAETAKGEEVGFRTLALDRRLSFNITAYRYEYSNLQVQFYDPTANTLIAANAGKLRTQGVEADADFRVPGIQGLSLRGSAAYNDAKFHDYIGQCYAGQTIAEGCNLNFSAGVYNAQNYENRVAPKAPHFAGRAGATLDVPVASSGLRLRFTGDVGYTSKYNYSDALRPDAIQKGFAKVDASITLKGPSDHWTVSLIGRNLTNQLVVTSANDIPFAGGTGTGTATGVRADMSAFVDNPREVFIELGVKF